MRREHFITFSLWVAALGSAVAITGFTGLFTDNARRPLWLMCLVGGLLLMISLLIVAFIAAVGDKPDSKNTERKPRMIPLLGMIASGALLLIFAVWFFWPRKDEKALALTQPPGVSAPTTSLDYTLSLKCNIVSRPTHAREDRSTYFVEIVTPAETNAAVGNLVEAVFFPPRSEPIVWNSIDVEDAERCTITNYGNVPITSAKILMNIKWLAVQDGESRMQSGAVLRETDFTFDGVALGPSPNQADYFYLMNYSDLYVAVFLPTTIAIRRAGSDKFEEVKLISNVSPADAQFSLPPRGWRKRLAGLQHTERPIVPVGGNSAADPNSGSAFGKTYEHTKCFDYSTQNGVTQIINGSSTFNVKFSKSSDQDIFVLSSASNISAVARVRHTPPKAIIEFDKLDSSSREYTVRVGEQFIVKNNSGEFLQGKVLSVKDDRSSAVDEVCFAYEFDQSGVGKFLAL